MTLFLEGNLEILIQVQVSFMYEAPDLQDSPQQIPVCIYFLLYYMLCKMFCGWFSLH